MVSSPWLGAHEQATACVNPFEYALPSASAVVDRDPFAEAEGAIEPGRANAVERLSSAPNIDPLVKSLNETLEQFAAAYRFSPRPRQTRGCVAKAFRRAGAIDADPDHAGGPPAPEANPFDEDPCAFHA